MRDYDSMSVHDLIAEIIELECRANTHMEFYGDKELAPIESALRKGAVRESSIGTIEVKIRESGDELSRPGDPDRIVTASEQFICQTWIPEGNYALVKIEESET